MQRPAATTHSGATSRYTAQPRARGRREALSLPPVACSREPTVCTLTSI